MKKSIYFLTTTCFFPIASYAAEVYSRPSMDLDRFDIGRYNALKAIEEAHSIVKSHRDFDDFLEESKKAVEAYEQQENMGYRLLHRHGNLHADHKMIESFGPVDGDVAIITQETQISATSMPFAPASWFVEGDDVFAFEFSNDPLVLQVKEYLQTVSLLQSLNELMDSYELKGALATAIVSRAQYEPLKPRFADGYEWVEQTIHGNDAFRNVLSLRKLTESKSVSYVPTTYSFTSLPGAACARRWFCAADMFGNHMGRDSSHFWYPDTGSVS
jgi:hypothetical protein